MAFCVYCGAPIENLQAACTKCGAVGRTPAPRLVHSLRIETGVDSSFVLFARGTELPASLADIFSTYLDGQSSVEIHLVEGENESASQNRHLGRFRLNGLRPQPRGVPQIQFVLRISVEGELVIEAEELGTENRRTFKGLIVRVE